MASVNMDGSKGKIKPRILLVVSNDLIRDIFKELFEISGHNTVAVERASDGLKTLKNECFDIVICDFDLHDGTGVAFFGSAKDACPEKRNILMITYGDLENITHEESRNIHYVIEKPFPFEELLRIVEKLQ